MDNADYSAIVKQMVQAMVTCFHKKDYSDKTFKAKVTEIIGKEKVRVLYCGNYYTVSSSILCNVDNYVRICAPCNNWNDLFVIENKTSGQTLKDLYESIKSIQLQLLEVQQNVTDIHSQIVELQTIATYTNVNITS